MKLAPLALLLVTAAAVAGCLQSDAAIDGRLLFSGRQIEKAGFVIIDGRSHVTFEDRIAHASPGKSGAANLWITDWETGEKCRLVANKSDRWHLDSGKDGLRFAIKNERTTATGAVGTLVRFTMGCEDFEAIEDVSGYGVSNLFDDKTRAIVSTRFYYKTELPGSRLTNLHLRNDAGDERVIEKLSGLVQFTEPDGLYMILGEDRTLVRLAAHDAPIETLRTHVTRMQLRGDEKYAILGVADPGAMGGPVVPKAIVLKLDDKSERPLPGKNPSYWLGFWGAEFAYSEAATGGTGARLHFFNVDTAADRVYVIPAGLADVTAAVPRSSKHAESLLIDSQGRLALFDAAAEPAVRILNLRAYSPSYTPDGKFLLYVKPDTSATELEGELVVQDADFKQPPRVISPVGASVQNGGFFFILGAEPLVFWAHFGRDAANLYYSNHETGAVRRVARGIREVTVTPRRIIGVVRVSEQDLVGDLVQIDAQTLDSTRLARSVSDVSIYGSQIAFIVRGRLSSERDGLWATTLKEIKTDAGN